LFIQSIANDSAFDSVGNSDILVPSSSSFILESSSAKRSENRKKRELRRSLHLVWGSNPTPPATDEPTKQKEGLKLNSGILLGA